jgi:hypothetical protein
MRRLGVYLRSAAAIATPAHPAALDATSRGTDEGLGLTVVSDTQCLMGW